MQSHPVTPRCVVRAPHALCTPLTALLAVLALLLPALAMAQERGYVGVGVRNPGTAEAEALGWEQTRGCYVVSILEDAPAGKAGVLVADIIVSVDGIEMDRIEDFVTAISSSSPGESVRLRVLRAKKERSITMLLGTRPASQPMPKTCSKYVPTLGRSIEVDCPDEG